MTQAKRKRTVPAWVTETVDGYGAVQAQPEGLARFRVDSYESALFTRIKDVSMPSDPTNVETIEVRTITMNPVNDNAESNRRFWAGTPSGQIRLGGVVPAAWEQFELGCEYYLTFTKA